MISIEENFDEIFGGGIIENTITQIYGPPASGKTNLCLILAVNIAKKNKNVLFIDTEGGFSIERVKQISYKYNLKEILKNILLITPTSYEEQKAAIGKISEILKNKDFGVIIVDSFTILYRLEDVEIQKKKQELGKQMEELAKISRKFNIPVFITNQVYYVFKNDNEDLKYELQEVTPVGGDVLEYWSKVIVELKIEQQSRIRVAILKKHKFIEEGKITKFRIVNEGIKIVK